MRRLLIALTLLCVTTYTYAHTPPAVDTENKCLINVPVMHMHEKPTRDSPFVSEGLYGHTAYVIKQKDQNWALVETEDGHQGYAELSALVPDNPQFRTSEHLVQTCSKQTQLYTSSNLKAPSLTALPVGAYLQLTNNSEKGLVQVQLLDGSKAWINSSDIGPISYDTIAEYCATISPITSTIFEKMPYSWRDNNPVALENLRYLTLTHWGFDGHVYEGEMVVHAQVADEVVAIFEELFIARYPIEKMHLVDAYVADDERSCSDNNSSAFCSRPIIRSDRWSVHSFGLAIDINPLLNPFKGRGTIAPASGAPFLNRKLECKGLIDENDAAYKAFTKRGWTWGGHWQSVIDYQHFEKEL